MSEFLEPGLILGHYVRFTPNSDRESGFEQKVRSALPPTADMCSALADVCFGPIADISDKPKIDGFHEHVENTTPDYDRSSCYHESGIKVRSLRGFCSHLRALSDQRVARQNKPTKRMAIVLTTPL